MGGLEVCRSALMIVLWSSAVNPLSTSLPLLSLLSTSPSSLSAIFFLVSGSLISVNTLLNVLLFYTRPLWSAYGSLLRHRFLTAVGSGRFWKGQSVPKISPLNVPSVIFFFEMKPKCFSSWAGFKCLPAAPRPLWTLPCWKTDIRMKTCRVLPTPIPNTR